MRILFFVIFLIFNQASADTSCRNLVGHCRYYACLEEKYQCHRSNYFHSFAENYCHKFDQRHNKFSAKGRKFLKSVKNCLQTHMESDSSELSCASSKTVAARHHVECYHENHFCDLGVLDKYNIVYTVLKPIFVDPIFRKVGNNIISECHMGDYQ